MNMIIGPNGTGKSTLVCAICLGLGWGPNNLGRAKETGEFVKHGAREAEIEIELAAGRGMASNPIIRRVLKREGNKNSYFLDGRSVPAKEIKEYAQKFDIQIDNLCSFLPQDRVVEFAGLSPVQLLEQTQQAAGSADMQEWHADLKSLGKQQRERKHDDMRLREELGEKTARQKASEGDVQRVRERSDLVTKIEAWDLYRPFLKYKSAKRRYETADSRKKEAEKELSQLLKEVQPALRAVEAKKEYATQVEKLLRQRQRLLQRQESTAQDKKAKHDNMTQTIKDRSNERDAEINGTKKHNQEIKRIEQVIQRLKLQMEHEEIEFDPADYNARIREKDQRIRQLREQTSELNAQTDRLRQQAATHKKVFERVTNDREVLNSQVGQQASKLRNKSKDTARAWEWVQEQLELDQQRGAKDRRFKGEIFGPPAISCTVRDARYMDAVESMLQMGDMLAFTCTHADDYRMLINELCGRNGLGLSDVTIRQSSRAFESFQRPLNKDGLERLAFDSWLIDQIEGPDPVRSMLCDSRSLHKTAVSLRAHDGAQFEAVKASPINSWVAGKQSYSITRRREYGEGAVSTSSRQVRPSTLFSDQPVAVEESRRLDQQALEARQAMDELRSQNDEIRKEVQTVSEEKETLQSEMRELEDEKAEKQRAVAAFRTLPNKLEAQQARLDDLEKQKKDARAKVESIGVAIDKLTLDKAQAALDYASSIELLRRLHGDLLEAELWFIEATSEHEALIEESSSVQRLLAERQTEVKELTVESKSAKKEALQLRDVALKISDQLSPEQAALHSEIQEEDAARAAAGETPYSMEDLEADIASAKNQLELLAEGNPNLMRDYERREKQIEDLKNRLNTLESDMQERAQRITDLRAQWEPELDHLVGKISDAFSYNFSKIGCAGQVEVYKDEEDFEAWSIRIQVKFRYVRPFSASRPRSSARPRQLT